MISCSSSESFRAAPSRFSTSREVRKRVSVDEAQAVIVGSPGAQREPGRLAPQGLGLIPHDPGEMTILGSNQTAARPSYRT